MWRCQIVGKVNKIDGSVAKVNRWFDGQAYLDHTFPSDFVLQGLVIKELEKRKDKGFPWCGDAVNVITPSGMTHIIEIPYSWERQQRLF